MRGRQQAYSNAAMQACLTIKVLFGLPLRQATGFVESPLELVGLDWSVPDSCTLCRSQKTLSVAIPYRGSAGPLHLLVDSTGIKAKERSQASLSCIASQYPVGQWVVPTAASGARYTLGSTSKHWRYGQLR
jgi:hypothetical protein